MRGDNLKIGSTVWVYDDNWRMYAKDAEGRSFGSPVYRESWRPWIIDGENSRNWIVGVNKTRAWRRFTISKKNPSIWICVTPEEVDEKCWENKHRYKILRDAERCNPGVLRKIAELIGYKEQTNG